MIYILNSINIRKGIPVIETKNYSTLYHAYVHTIKPCSEQLERIILKQPEIDKKTIERLKNKGQSSKSMIKNI